MEKLSQVLTVVSIVTTGYSIFITKLYRDCIKINSQTNVQSGSGQQQTGGGVQVGAGSGNQQTADQTTGNVGGNQYNIHIGELHVHEHQTQTVTKGTGNGDAN